MIVMDQTGYFEREGLNMLFGKKDKDVRLTDAQYKRLVGSMNRKEKREFDRRQEQLRRDSENDRFDAWLDFEMDEL